MMHMMNENNANLQIVVAQDGAQNNAEAEENAEQEDAEVVDPRVNIRYVLGTGNGKNISRIGLGCIVASVVFMIIASALPWFQVQFDDYYYAKDQFLWLFLLPPLTIIPLIAAAFGRGRLSWMHCWTVTVVSIDVPSAVIFVSFGTSLVYTGIGSVEWRAGAFMILIAHLASITGGLLFMKFAQLVEAGPPVADENGEPIRTGPITVAVTIDDSLHSPKPSFAVIATGTPASEQAVSSEPSPASLTPELAAAPALAPLTTKLDGMEATYIYAMPTEEPKDSDDSAPGPASP